MRTIGLLTAQLVKDPRLRCFCVLSGSQGFGQRNASRRYDWSRAAATRGRRRLSTAQAVVEKAPQSWKPYLRIMRVDKPIGTWLLYWPCTWSLAMASAPGVLPDPYLLLLFGAGAFCMRSAGCVINDLWDKDIDRMVERTRDRPLAKGDLTTTQAVALLSGLLSASLLILLQLNWHSVAVGAASMALVVCYPLAKRYTYWPQFILGMTLNWGVLLACLQANWPLADALPIYFGCVCYTVIYDTIYSHQSWTRAAAARAGLTFNWGCLLGWSAVDGAVPPAALSLYVAGIAWTLVYDTVYAHQDKTDDLIVGVKSTALRLGEQTKPSLAAFATAMVSALGYTGYSLEQTWPFYVGLSATAAHLGWQIATVDIDSPQDCANKFRTNQWLGLILFVSICAGNLLKDTL